MNSKLVHVYYAALNRSFYYDSRVLMYWVQSLGISMD